MLCRPALEYAPLKYKGRYTEVYHPSERFLEKWVSEADYSDSNSPVTDHPGFWAHL
jgi:hypothetical protein